jgi:predicted dehydrogenase
MEKKIKVAVVGVGKFGRHHARVYNELPDAELVGIYDQNPAQSSEVAKEFSCRQFLSLDELSGEVNAATVAVPTTFHAEIGLKLMQAGIDILVEKPMAKTELEAAELSALASKNGRILQIGHLERFNPAVQAAKTIVTSPLFFEVHRLSLFSPRSLEVDVVLDLMIHDLDILLTLVNCEPSEIRAVGLAVLTPKIDIANVRLAFPTGCVANLTASRVSTEQVRKLRWFQPHQYISIDYARQEASVTSIDVSQTPPSLSYRRLESTKGEPLKIQLAEFLKNVRERTVPTVGGPQGQRALSLAHRILEEIDRHAEKLEAFVSSSQSIPDQPENFEAKITSSQILH